MDWAGVDNSLSLGSFTIEPRATPVEHRADGARGSSLGLTIRRPLKGRREYALPLAALVNSAFVRVISAPSVGFVLSVPWRAGFEPGAILALRRIEEDPRTR